MTEAGRNDLDFAGVRTIAAKLYGEGPLAPLALERLRPFILPFERLAELVPRGAHILDVGCGAGLFLAILAASGRIAQGRGIDVSGRAIERARRMTARQAEPDRLVFECVSPDDPLPAGAFDVVSMIDVMHHVPAPAQRAFFAAAVERVRPGGLLLYKDMADAPVLFAWANRLHDLVLARQWIHYAGLEEVDDWAASLGLQCVKTAVFDRFWYRHELKLFRKSES